MYAKENHESIMYMSKKRGQPRIIWLEDVLEDIRRMKLKGYTKMATDRRY